MSTLEKAIAIAAQAHQGQKDKVGAPYILHPLRMMLKMDDEKEMIAAILHDVVEDTDWTLRDLAKEGFSEEVLEAVDRLTRRAEESYEEFIERIKPNPIARNVKLADLEDNMDIRRFGNMRDRDVERLKKYQAAWFDLTGTNKPTE